MSTNPTAERAGLNAAARSEQILFHDAIERDALDRAITAALSAVDVLVDQADAARRFSLRALADNFFWALDAYREEQAGTSAPVICESCNAGYHETASHGCRCACHVVAKAKITPIRETRTLASEQIA